MQILSPDCIEWNKWVRKFEYSSKTNILQQMFSEQFMSGIILNAFGRISMSLEMILEQK